MMENDTSDKEMSDKVISEPKTAHRRLTSSRGETLSPARNMGVGEDEVLVWPHLIYKELLVAMFAIIVFWVMSLLINAPLEGLANPTHSPNPAKAPWYFVGLQELLVYFDPWIGGVIVPALIIGGLMAIPYLDFNREATGKYNFSQRKFAVTMLTIGLTMWLLLSIIGGFFRGPNWGWYWPWESWAVLKEIVPTRNLPTIWGLLLLLIYFTLGMVIPKRLYSKFYKQLGPVRYVMTMVLVLLLFGVLGKIFLRLIFNVKYIAVTPWFNI